MRRHFALSTYLRRSLGRPARKIPLDAGFSCPNRDGSLSTAGCLFCNPQGSGSGLFARGVSLQRQWDLGLARLAGRRIPPLPLAYLQSYSNTHGPLARLAEVLAEVAALPGIAGLFLGTRPDCLDEARLALLSGLPFAEVHLELGLQSANDETLARINRGHDAACFARAARAAHAAGLKVAAHVIAGLPGETGEDLVRTIEFVNALPVHGIKFHNLYVCRGSGLEAVFRRGGCELMPLAAYAEAVVEALVRLRPDITVHRLAAQPAPGELMAPDWAADKAAVQAAVLERLARNGAGQGKKTPQAAARPPAWFEPDTAQGCGPGARPDTSRRLP
jgi:radical SAM protein (TIGR01212 family)